jgi:hypothetical protein
MWMIKYLKERKSEDEITSIRTFVIQRFEFRKWNTKRQMLQGYWIN